MQHGTFLIFQTWFRSEAGADLGLMCFQLQLCVTGWFLRVSASLTFWWRPVPQRRAPAWMLLLELL